MSAIANPGDNFNDLDGASTDSLERHLSELEANIAVLRDVQARMLIELEARQIVTIDGSRSLVDWVASRLDIRHTTASELIEYAESIKRDRLTGQVSEGSFDRRLVTSRLRRHGANDKTVRDASERHLAGVEAMVARHRRTTREAERAEFAGRYLVIQPTLDESTYALYGRLHGIEGRVVSKTLAELADSFPALPDGTRESMSARTADALHQVCMDRHDGSGSGSQSRSGPSVTIFVDACDAAASNGERGVWLDDGTPVGPATLERLLCDATIEITALTADGTPLAVGKASTAITPRTRRFVLHRDGGMCTIDGCRSRYRLQPHHVNPRARLGNNDPANLTTLCFFHHHIVIHRHGYELAPDSPPQRRRFLRRRPIEPRAG